MSFENEFYFISKEKIENVPSSIQKFSNAIHHLGETKKEKAKLYIESERNFRRIFEFLDGIEFDFKSIAYVKNGDESLLTEFILKETFDAIFVIDSPDSEKSLSFINSYIQNFSYLRNHLEKSHRFLQEIESYVETYANTEMHNFYKIKLIEISDLSQSLSGIKAECIAYLKPEIIKLFKA